MNNKLINEQKLQTKLRKKKIKCGRVGSGSTFLGSGSADPDPQTN